MADADKTRLARIGKLVEVLRDLQAKTYEVTEEMQRLLAGEAGIGDRLKQVETAWRAAWSSRYHGDYVFTFAKDRPQIKRLLKTFTAEDLQVRMLNYIRNDDRYFVERRHPFGLFVSTINQHAPAGDPDFGLEAADEFRPIGCKHEPPCRNDQQHTQKRMSELRA